MHEIRADDAVTGEFTNPGTEEYPPLEEFMSLHRQSFEEFFLDYLKLELLSTCLVEGQKYAGSEGR